MPETWDADTNGRTSKRGIGHSNGRQQRSHFRAEQVLVGRTRTRLSRKPLVYFSDAHRLGVDFGSSPSLEGPPRIEQDGHRAIVDKFDLHRRLEATDFAVNSGFANSAHKVLIKLIRDLRRRCLVE